MRQGFTIIEVLISLAILVVAISVLSSTIIGSTRHDRNSGQRTQAVELLNYIGRYALEGSSVVIPASPATLKTINYGSVASAFPDLLVQGGFSDPSLYKATITFKGQVALSTASANQYDINVCWKDKDQESCVLATTLGPLVAGKTLAN
jgi:prepilin-type N-terminal cleavage/methylation domain-containing protein